MPTLGLLLGALISALAYPTDFDPDGHRSTWFFAAGAGVYAYDDDKGDTHPEGVGFAAEVVNTHEFEDWYYFVPMYGLYTQARFGSQDTTVSAGLRAGLTGFVMEAGGVLSPDGPGLRFGALLWMGVGYIHIYVDGIGERETAYTGVTVQMLWVWEDGELVFAIQ